MDKKIIYYAKQICKAFNIDGVLDLDVVLANNGQPIVIDASVRLSGSIGGTVQAGMNFPAQIIRHLNDMPKVKYEIQDGFVIRPFLTMVPIPLQNNSELL